MSPLPRSLGSPIGTACVRTQPRDFIVREQLGFDPEGEGEHVFLHLEKQGLNTLDLVARVSQLSGIDRSDIGYSGLKDRNALTSQWLSVRMAGKAEPDWSELEVGSNVKILDCRRHLRKLKRGVHRCNRFTLTLRGLTGDRESLEQRLASIKQRGVPNYFGEQRFGREGSTLAQAKAWRDGGGRRISRNRRSLFFSALRAELFNQLLAVRVDEGTFAAPATGDACQLQGSRSVFLCVEADEVMQRRATEGDIHPALPLWGVGIPVASGEVHARQANTLREHQLTCSFLETKQLELSYRAARLLADDFCWQFCDDDTLTIEFSLGAGGYATAVLAELVEYTQGDKGSGNGSEQG
ncbi:MAG: tRNA pseudouridine(13) synthase TruD [Halioglobus sp.]